MKKLLHFQHVLKVIARYVFLTMLALITSCSDDGPGFIRIDEEYCTKTQLDCTSYLPTVQVGDYWIGNDESKTVITGTTVLDGKTFFELSWSETSDASTVADRWFERYDNNQILFKVDESSAEELLADFSLEIDDEWTVGAWTYKLVSTTGQVIINGVTFSNAYVFHQINDEELLEVYFFPGLSWFAQNHYTGGVLQEDQTWKIVEFKLGGKVYKVGN